MAFSKKKILYGFICLVIGGLVVYGIWAMFFQYQPRAYVGIARYGPWGIQAGYPESINSFVLEVDINSGTVTDSFPVSEHVPNVDVLAISRKREELFVAGSGGPFGIKKADGIDVYDIHSYELKRHLPLPGKKRIDELRISPDGSKLFINNPYRKNSPGGEKGKGTWVLNSKNGEFIKGVSKSLIRYISNSGKKFFSFSGDKKLHSSYAGDKKLLFKPGLSVYSVERDTGTILFKGWKRLKEEYGGFYYNKYNFNFPRIERGDGKLRFYNRSTYEKLGELSLFGNWKEKIIDKRTGIGLQMTPDGQFQVIGLEVGDPSPQTPDRHYLRIIDVKKIQLHKQVKIWEGRGTQTNPAVY